MIPLVVAALGTGLAGVRAAESRSAGPDDAVRHWVEAELPALVETYRQFHAHPELSGQERETPRDSLACGGRPVAR